MAAALTHWYAAPGAKGDLRGAKLRQLARSMEHTDAVHEFLARLAAETRRTSGASLTELTPPHRAARYFQFHGRTRAILPDAGGVIRLGRVRLPFVLEWERRVKHPSKAADRISPYLRYFTSGSPRDDYGATPIILVAFDDVGAETQFLLQAQAQLAEKRVHVPVLVTHAAALSETGIWGRFWRSPSDPDLRRTALRAQSREGRRTSQSLRSPKTNRRS